MLEPTRRLLALALAGALPMAISGSYEAAIVVGLLWLVAVALLAAVDAWFTPPERNIIWSREHEGKLSLGVPNPIHLTCHNRSRRNLRIRVRDAVPSLLRAGDEAGAGVCPPLGEWRFTYPVVPVHRGDFDFGVAGAAYLGPLGLAWRRRRIRLTDSVKVYPNLKAVRQYEALSLRDRLQDLGLRSSWRWGEGSEFDRLRSYMPDDEYRRVNWKATARRGEPVVVDYRVERSQSILLAFDTGRLMSAHLPLADEQADNAALRTTGISLSRLDYALNAATLLAFAALRYGDRVGLLAFSDRIVRFVSPRGGHGQFLAITENLYNLEPEPTETSFGEALLYLTTRASRRSLVVLFTDVAEPSAAAGLVAAVSRLQPRHLPVVVTLQDPEIARLADMVPTTETEVYERAVARRFLEERARTLRQLTQQGVWTVDVSADKLSASVVNRYLEIKARGVL